MSLRFQRLILILLSLFMILGSILLILYNARENISYFYTPSEIDSSDVTNMGTRRQVPYNTISHLNVGKSWGRRLIDIDSIYPIITDV